MYSSVIAASSSTPAASRSVMKTSEQISRTVLTWGELLASCMMRQIRRLGMKDECCSVCMPTPSTWTDMMNHECDWFAATWWMICLYIEYWFLWIKIFFGQLRCAWALMRLHPCKVYFAGEPGASTENKSWCILSQFFHQAIIFMYPENRKKTQYLKIY